MTRMRRYEVMGVFVISAISALLGSIFLNYYPTNFITWLLLPNTNSLWQAGKLMVVCILIYSILEYIVFGRKYANFFFAKAATLLLAPLLFVLACYYIDVLVGSVVEWAHYLVYFMAIIFGQWVSYYFMQKQLYFKLVNAYGVLTILLIIFVFVAYSSYTFTSPIFEPMQQYKSIIKNVY
jgi:hypothetical protein